MDTRPLSAPPPAQEPFPVPHKAIEGLKFQAGEIATKFKF